MSFCESVLNQLESTRFDCEGSGRTYIVVCACPFVSSWPFFQEPTCVPPVFSWIDTNKQTHAHTHSRPFVLQAFGTDTVWIKWIVFGIEALPFETHRDKSLNGGPIQVVCTIISWSSASEKERTNAAMRKTPAAPIDTKDYFGIINSYMWSDFITFISSSLSYVSEYLLFISVFFFFFVFFFNSPFDAVRSIRNEHKTSLACTICHREIMF